MDYTLGVGKKVREGAGGSKGAGWLLKQIMYKLKGWRLKRERDINKQELQD